MIICPKCGLEKHLVLEQPSWYISKIDKLSIDCYCTECEIYFEVRCKLTEINVIKKSIRKSL